MGDKGYVGPQDDTHSLTRVTPKRGILSQQDQVRNTSIDRERVAVEQFLGRISRLWTTMARTWRWEHGHFDTDFRIACLLTNEHISTTELDPEDGDFYNQLLHSFVSAAEQRRQKRTASARISRHIRKVHRLTCSVLTWLSGRPMILNTRSNDLTCPVHTE